MTRREAIEILKQYSLYSPTSQIEEALDMAIKALSAEDVSREAHYDAVANKITDMEERGFVSVVRCKDCKHRDLFSCPLADNDFQKDNDFCAWGERKGGDDE